MRKITDKTKTMLYIELVHGVELEALLHKLYIEEKKSIREIAALLSVHYNTINKWLQLTGIQMRLPHDKLLELIDIKRKLKESN